MIKCNGIEIKATIFPDGTSQVWQTGLDLDSDACIDWEFENEAELFHVAQLVHLIKENPREVYKKTPNVVLNIPYFEYPRFFLQKLCAYFRNTPNRFFLFSSKLSNTASFFCNSDIILFPPYS